MLYTILKYIVMWNYVSYNFYVIASRQTVGYIIQTNLIIDLTHFKVIN